MKNLWEPQETGNFLQQISRINENSAIKLSYPHPISFHYVAVKTARRNYLEHEPKSKEKYYCIEVENLLLPNVRLSNIPI